MSDFNENIITEQTEEAVEICTVFEEVIDNGSVFCSLLQNNNFHPVKPKKRNKKAVIITIAAALLSIAVVSAVCFAVVFFSPKAKFFRAFEDIFERHFGENEIYEDVASLNDVFDKFQEGFDMNFTGIQGDREQNLSIKYNGSAMDTVIKEDDEAMQLYVDKDGAVLSDTKDTSYGLTFAPFESKEGAQENEVLYYVKNLFEYSADERIRLSEDLKSIINKNLGSDYFKKCVTEYDGIQYDAVRFFASEIESADLFASILEDINNSENEVLRLQTAAFLIKYFSVDAGVDVAETINNAIDFIAENSCNIEVIIGFDSSSPVAFSIKIAVGENTFETEYNFIRNGEKADVYFGVLLKSDTNNFGFEYEGVRSFKNNDGIEVADVEFTFSSNNKTLKLSGEANVAYVNSSLNSFSIALSSEDLNERFGVVVTLGENFSVSLTSMTSGYGTGIVLTSDVKSEEGKLTVTNGKLSINEIASDDLLEYYQIDASELGTKNFMFDGTVEYTKNDASLTFNVNLPDEVTYSVKADVKGESGFFASLFKDNIFESDYFDITANFIKTENGTTSDIGVKVILKADKSEIARPEVKTSLDSMDVSIDSKKAGQMTSHFLSARNKNDMAEALWQCIVTGVYELTGTELTDTNRVEFDKSVYDEIKLGETTLKDVKALFNAEPVVMNETYVYFSSDFDEEQRKGIVIQIQFDKSGFVSVKEYSDFTESQKGVAEVEKVNYKKIKKGMTREELLKLFEGVSPVMRYDLIQNNQKYEYLYYGVKDDTAVVAIEIIDGKVERYQY